jgi:hypothetical protein
MWPLLLMYCYPKRRAMTSKVIGDLYNALDHKTQEIVHAVAKSYGVNLASLDPEHLEQFSKTVAETIDRFETALMEGETPDEWRPVAEGLKRTPIGQLLLQRHEIAQKIVSRWNDSIAAWIDKNHDG